MVILNVSETYPLISTYRDNHTIVLKTNCIEIYKNYVLVVTLTDGGTLTENQAFKVASVYINTVLSIPKEPLNFTAETCTYYKGYTQSFGVLRINHTDNTSEEIRITSESYCDSDGLKNKLIDIFNLWYGVEISYFDKLQMAFPNITKTVEKADKEDIILARNRCFLIATLKNIQLWNKTFKVFSKVLMASDAEIFSTPNSCYVIKSNRLLRSVTVSKDYENDGYKISEKY